jgi:hypothetical protein|tara:strand:+ start:456 stop:674 length:219 start_codon:yes stop_codon:yes gene_type:complete
MTPEEEIDFITSIIDRGFHYDRVNDEYVRKWITEGGEESILEIYKKKWDTNEWKQMMVGYGDNIFYEEILNY